MVAWRLVIDTMAGGRYWEADGKYVDAEDVLRRLNLLEKIADYAQKARFHTRDDDCYYLLAGLGQAADALNAAWPKLPTQTNLNK